MTIKFGSPPINEVAMATYFNPPLVGLRSEHIGLFWNIVKKDLPSVSQQPPVGGMDNFQIGSDVFPMPRYWLIASNDINLIQLQKNAFMFNWRRRDSDYPHYDNLKPVFDQYYSLFHDFIISETDIKKISIDVCELTYINTIESCEYWSGPEDTNKVIPMFSIPDIGLPTKSAPGYNCNYVYVLEDDLQLRVSIRHAQSAQNPEVPVLVLEIRASGRIASANKSDADSWFDRGHQAIIDCFVRITNPDIQRKHWKLKETSA